MKKILLFLSLFIISNLAKAHNPDQSYLYFSTYEDRIEGEFQARAEQWNNALGTNLPKIYTKDELEAIFPQIKKYILENVSFSSQLGEHPIIFTEPDVLSTGNRLGTFSRVHFRLGNITQIPENLEVTNNLFIENDENVRSLLLQAYNWKAGIEDNEFIHSAIFTPQNPTQNLNLSEVTTWTGFILMIKMGIRHIWGGFDHMFFLLALALPAVAIRLPNRKSIKEIFTQWEGVEKFKPPFWYIIKVLAFFVIAHTITLNIAALGVFDLNDRLVESVIALSVALAALHNIVPIFIHKEWLIAFVFGLFHGFGFAGLLSGVGLNGKFLATSLLGFNLGVEIGLLFFILILFPVLFFMRKTKIYSYSVILASSALILLSLIWTYERLFDVDIPMSAMLGLV